jgi:hypothetical protein
MMFKRFLFCGPLYLLATRVGSSYQQDQVMKGNACFSVIIQHVPERNVNVLGHFFLVSCSGARLSPLGTSATNWPIVPAPGDR